MRALQIIRFERRVQPHLESDPDPFENIASLFTIEGNPFQIVWDHEKLKDFLRPSSKWVDTIAGGTAGLWNSINNVYSQLKNFDKVENNKSLVTSAKSIRTRIDKLISDANHSWWISPSQEKSAGENPLESLFELMEQLKKELAKTRVEARLIRNRYLNGEFKDTPNEKIHWDEIFTQIDDLTESAHSLHLTVRRTQTRMVKMIINFLMEYVIELTSDKEGGLKKFHKSLKRMQEPVRVMLGKVIELENGEEELTAFLKRKYMLLRRVNQIYTMASCTGTEPIMNEAFIHSSPYRRAMLTSGCLIWRDDKQKIILKPLEYENWKENLENAGESLNSLIKRLNSSIKKANEGSKNDLSLIFWPGCELIIPESIKVILGWNKPGLTTYIKSKCNKECLEKCKCSPAKCKEICRDNCTDNCKEGEIVIEESPWHIGYMVNNRNLIEFNDYRLGDYSRLMVDGNYPGEGGGMNSEFRQIIGSAISVPELTAGTEVINGSISKKEIETRATGGNNVAKNKYAKVDLAILHALEDCEIVLQFPYVPPSADAMLSIRFEGGENQRDNTYIPSCIC